ncbi:hypothetical protein VPH35_016620 [Triticum aestivum]|uniref:uncharacterized protein n=1 Tax=Triticum aestivum TaxID=4565 RepID=UPI000842EFED|nr:uncharacterized protein LOC123182814 [Triticum aestivum]
MASAIRFAAALRQRLPRLLSSATRSVPRALGEERPLLVRRAGGPAMGDPRLFSSSSAGKSYTHPCKLNLRHKKQSLEDSLAYLNRMAKKEARDWREMREHLEASEQRQIELEKVYKRQDRVVNCAAATLFLALLAGNVFFG